LFKAGVVIAAQDLGGVLGACAWSSRDFSGIEEIRAC
jgi:hypothetical protein